jgi:hypothetical protein
MAKDQGKRRINNIDPEASPGPKYFQPSESKLEASFYGSKLDSSFQNRATSPFSKSPRFSVIGLTMK